MGRVENNCDEKGKEILYEVDINNVSDKHTANSVIRFKLPPK